MFWIVSSSPHWNTAIVKQLQLLQGKAAWKAVYAADSDSKR